MSRAQIHVGLEIGTSKTCMVVAEIKPDASVKILGVGETSSAGVRKGEISDYAQARSCVKATLLDAEDASDVEINSVFLAVTGSHIIGTNNIGTYRLPEHQNEISEEHIDEAREIASDVQIPSENVYLHHLVRHYVLDGQIHAGSPLGLMGRTMEADFHIIHGVETRIQNSIKCVREIPLDVDDVVFSPVASAQIALTQSRKEAGAIVIDIGAGTTDYILYLDGAIAASGCIPVGGDHITNDIHLVTHVPLSKAEKIKIKYGDASGDAEKSRGTLKVEDESGFPEIEIEKRLLNDVIRWRLEETLRFVQQRLPKDVSSKIGTGVFLTGGSSLMNGIAELACEIFRLPVYKPERPDVSGVHAYFKDPQYSTALGLIRYAQILEHGRTSKGGITSFLHSFWPFHK